MRRVAKKVLREEARAIERLAQRLDSRFDRAVRLISRSKGRVVLVGMGKPGIIAQKISASLASTGTPSITLHPADAAHGDLGRVTCDDVVIALSKSGETEEILRLLPVLKRIGCKLIAMTGNVQSQLAKMSDVVLEVFVKSETDPLDIVPTSSTTCMLAMGDALTIVIAKKKKFGKKDFAMLHPGGMLGKTFHLTVKDVMRKGKTNPCVSPGTNLKNTLLKITAARAGAACVVNAKGRCIGIFTDGDLRRRVDEIVRDMSRPVSDFMTHRPILIREDQLASQALEVLKRKQIDELPVVDAGGKTVGLLDVQDLLKEGFIL